MYKQTPMLTPPRLGWLFAAFTLVMDQFSKWYLLEVMDMATRREPIILSDFFALVMVWNHGISFGLFSNHGIDARWPLMLLALIITAIMARWLHRASQRFTALAIGLIIGGALGNVIDRARFGAVADFFYAHIGQWGWPAFNIADAAICIGVALLLVESMFKRKQPTDE